MCYDDFDFDGYDCMDDDFSEDIIDEEYESESDQFDEQEDDPESAFGFREAFILGGMIVGQAYEEALDEKEQRDKKNNDDGDDLI